MAINTIEYAQIFQQMLDKQIVAKSSTGWMEGNTGNLIYNGGNTVRIPKIDMDGLGNYSRSEGFAQGASTLVYETFTLSQDRARAFSLDEMDVNESNFVANASNLMGEFQRVKVIPEIDAYRYSKIASLAIDAGKAIGGYTPDETNIYSTLRGDIAKVQDLIGADTPLVITMSTMTLNTLENSSELQRFLRMGAADGLTGNGFTGNVNTEFKSIDNIPIIEVPSARLKTAYVFNDGVTAGQTQGGFTPAAGAKTINWIITGQGSPIAVSKTDNVRIFDPSINQSARAWKIDYRKYHELWIPDKQMDTIYVNVKEALV